MHELEFDTIEFKLRRDKAEEIRSRLACFGWELEREKADRFSSEIVHVRFVRPHKVAQKDRLQLLQVRVEIALKRQAKYEHIAQSRAAAFGLVFGLMFALVAGLGIAFAVNGFCLPLAYTLIGIAAAGITVNAFLSTALKRHDGEKYARLMRENAENLDKYCRAARAITGKGGDV